MPSIQPVFAQQQTLSHQSPNNAPRWGIDFWIVSNVTIILIVVGVVIYNKLQLRKLRKSLKFEEFKGQDLQKRLKLALVTIKKMETNPDLVHSREFNLDYLRMRMDEEMFHSLIINRLKIKITQIITVALRPNTSEDNTVGIVGSGRQINQVFDVTYEIPNRQGDWKTRVLFRVQIKLTKLPIQSSHSTINQILDCIEAYLSPKPEGQGQKNWQPAIQGQLVKLDWDQDAKPTPLLVLEQFEQGINVPTRNQSRFYRR
jgi:hypothetical protein